MRGFSGRNDCLEWDLYLKCFMWHAQTSVGARRRFPTVPHEVEETRYTVNSYEVGLLSPLLSLVVGSPIVLPYKNN
jgi:hypothetical protein